MPANAYQYICNEMPRMIPVLDSNYSLSSFLQSFYANVIHQCRNRGVDPADVRIRRVFVNDEFLIADMDYPKKVGSTHAMYHLWVQRAESIEYLLRKNMMARNFLRVAVYAIERWCSDRGVSLKDVEVRHSVFQRSTGRLFAKLETPVDIEEVQLQRGGSSCPRMLQ